MTVDYDTSTGEYDFNRWGIGLFNRKLWLLHEIGDTDDELGHYGIQLQQEW